MALAPPVLHNPDFFMDQYLDSPDRSLGAKSTVESISGDESDITISPEYILAQLRALQLQHNGRSSPVQVSPVELQTAGSGPLLSGLSLAGLPRGLQQPPRHLLQAQLAAQQRGMPRQRRNEEQIRRTVYVNELDHGMSEQELAAFFVPCGAIVDCRICGDANSAMRFGFIEFFEEAGARRALSRSGAVLGSSVLRVSPSKTAIVPVNNQYLPRSEEERAAVARTVYVANIHRIIERDILHAFFSNICGPVAKIRLLGDALHDTKIAFVEFFTLDSAAAALLCTGTLLGPLPIRVSASKTPVRTESRRAREVVPSQHAQLQQQQPQAMPRQQWPVQSASPFAAGGGPPLLPSHSGSGAAAALAQSASIPGTSVAARSDSLSMLHLSF